MFTKKAIAFKQNMAASTHQAHKKRFAVKKHTPVFMNKNFFHPLRYTRKQNNSCDWRVRKVILIPIDRQFSCVSEGQTVKPVKLDQSQNNTFDESRKMALARIITVPE
uniref:Uncharacterized protein n=1 Tax=Cacopsylla melanoneura TaxID=428564 RepID=A0A8D8W6L5_9HEMI